MTDRDERVPVAAPVRPLALEEATALPASLDRIENEDLGARGASRPPHRLTVSRNPGDTAFRLLTGGAAALVLVVAVTMIVVLVSQSRDAISHFGLSILGTGQTAAFPFSSWASVAGTLYSSLLALAVAGPIGLLIAVFLAEIAPLPIRLGLGFMVEFLAAIPSVVYGLWALFVLVPLVNLYVIPFTQQHFGATPFFPTSPYASGNSIFTAVLVLATMILPTIAAISRDILVAVPASQREAMLALGATRWETTWKVVVPFARAGIVGGMMLGLARALGETMAVQMVIGNSQSPPSFSLINPATTIPATIVNQLPEATAGLYRSSLMELALILLIITMLLGGLARILVWSVTRKYAL